MRKGFGPKRNRRVIAIIPARGGSKGIPHKNIVDLNGQTLISYSIQAALNTRLISRVIVSTDDSQIAAAARCEGAEVIKRPSAISGDKASSEAALLHALDYLEKSEKFEPDTVVFLQATSPFRKKDDIERAIKIFDKEKADSLLSVSPVHGFVWRLQNKKLSSVTYDYRRRQMRQDAPEDMIENGSIYISKPASLRKLKNRLGGKIAVYRMGAVEGFQIDEPADLELAKKLMPVYLASAQTSLPAEFKRVRMVVFDFDGVMTDNSVYLDQNGKETVACNRSDGLGLGMLKKTNIRILVLSKEKNPVVGTRCRKLGIDYVQGCDNKIGCLKKLAKRYRLKSEAVAYVGNDINDVECLQWAGLPIAVADAFPPALAAARIVTRHKGGKGAVREICEALIKHHSKGVRHG